MSRPICAALVALAGLTWGVDVYAFHTADSFMRTANRGGASEILYTGSPRFRGYDCRMCHQDTSGSMSVQAESDPPELLAEGVYKPLQTYTITVELVGEQQPEDEEPLDRLFVAELVDDAGTPVGHYEEIELSSLQRKSGDVNVGGAVFGANDRARWSFTYHAPAKGTGRVAFHLGAVAGDGGASQPEPRPPSDPFGDQVAIFTQRACEEFTPCDLEDPVPEEAVSPVGHGCSVGGDAAHVDLLLWLLALAPLCRRRRS